jgi:hypothetical protein
MYHVSRRGPAHVVFLLVLLPRVFIPTVIRIRGVGGGEGVGGGGDKEEGGGGDGVMPAVARGGRGAVVASGGGLMSVVVAAPGVEVRVEGLGGFISDDCRGGRGDRRWVGGEATVPLPRPRVVL